MNTNRNYIILYGQIAIAHKFTRIEAVALAKYLNEIDSAKAVDYVAGLDLGNGLASLKFK